MRNWHPASYLWNPGSESILETSSLDIFFETICHALHVNASISSFNFVPNNIHNILSLRTTSLSLAFILQPLTHIFFKSYLTSSNHLFLGFPADFFLWDIIKHFLHSSFFSGILSTYPVHRYLPSLIAEIRGNFDKSRAPPGRKKATATELGIYSTYSPRNSIHFLSRCSNFCKPLNKKFRRLSVQSGLRGSNDLRVGRKMATFLFFFSPGNR